MYIKEINLPFEEEVHVYAIGDLHEGAGNVNYVAFRKMVDIIKKDQCKSKVVFLLGDMIDNIIPTDPRFDAASICEKYKIKDLEEFPRKQVEEVAKLLMPIRENIKVILKGNHEITFLKRHHFNASKYLCEVLGLGLEAYGGQTCLVNLRLLRANSNRSEVTYTAALKHGMGGAGKLNGYPANKIWDTFLDLNADIYLMGHLHRMIDYVVRQRELYKGTTRIIKKVFGVTGCYLEKLKEGYDSYYENGTGHESSIGSLCVKIYPRSPKEETQYFTEKYYL